MRNLLKKTLPAIFISFVGLQIYAADENMKIKFMTLNYPDNTAFVKFEDLKTIGFDGVLNPVWTSPDHAMKMQSYEQAARKAGLLYWGFRGTGEFLKLACEGNKQANCFTQNLKNMNTASLTAWTKTLEGTQTLIIDEPHWTDTGLVTPSEILLCDACRKEFERRFNLPLPELNMNSGRSWYYYILMRNQVLGEVLSGLCQEFKAGGGKLSGINLGSFNWESGAGQCADFPLLLDTAREKLDYVGADPYYTLFVERLRFAGAMFNVIDSYSHGKPMIGWSAALDGVHDGEGCLSVQRPSAIGIYNQFWEYLMHGVDVFAIFTYAGVKKDPEAVAYVKQAISWAKQNRIFFDGNPQKCSSIGLYFSENTFYVHDLFPRAFARGCGPLGQYFDFLQTYYTLSYAHVPVDCITAPFGKDYYLAEKLKNIKTLIIVNALNLSETERTILEQWVGQGGTLIVAGETGKYDQFGFTNVAEAALDNLLGVRFGKLKQREHVKLLDKEYFNPLHENDTIPCQGSSEINFARLYEINCNYSERMSKEEENKGIKRFNFRKKWGCLTRTSQFGKMEKFEHAEQLVTAGAPELHIVKADIKILAEYSDGTPAITLNKLKKGEVIVVSPTDLFTSNLNDECVNFVKNLIATPSNQLIESNLPCQAEINVLTRDISSREKLYVIHVLNHLEDTVYRPFRVDELKNIELKFNIPEGWAFNKIESSSPDNPSFEAKIKNRDPQKLDMAIDSLKCYGAIGVFLTRQDK
ncbi:MAG: DUF4350 domain-containing protein [Victivallales bacterium]